MISCYRKSLASGLRLVAVEMPHLHSVEIAIYLKVGGRNDPPEKAGLSHFLEHMLFRGTAEFPSNLELETAFEAIGGSVNAATDEESTCYFSRVHPGRVGEGLGLFASMLLRPTMPGIEIEKKIIAEEAVEDLNEQGEETNPHNLTSRLLWPEHPLGMPTIGYLDTIRGFSCRDLEDHLHRFYSPANAVVVISGNIKADHAFTEAEKAFASWSGPKPPDPSSPREIQGSPQSVFVKDSDSQVHLLLSFRGFARGDQRIMTSRLLRRILCGGGSSRLFMTLRERLGIVYSVDATISAYEETGSFAVELSTMRENVPLAVGEVLREARRLSAEPIAEAELERVKQGYLYDLEYSRDSAYEMQMRYGWGELMGMFRHIEDDRAEVEMVTAEAVRETAEALFAPCNLNLAVVGPWKSGDRKAVEKILNGYERGCAVS